MNLDFDPTIDHYKVLGVAAGASADEIKKAYRKLAKANHPDSTGGDKTKEARFKEISSAYEILGDAKKRAQYDELRLQLRSGHVRAGAGARHGRGAGASHAGPQVWDLSDLFGQFFAGGAAGGTGPGSVRVEHVDMDDGDGWSPFGQAGPRQRPGARRRARRQEPHEPPRPEERKLQAPDGTWLTLQGSDVHSELRVPFADAILGAVREVATLTGTTSIKVPPGTAGGRKLRLRGKGLGTPDGGVGDHYVTIQIDVPTELDDEGRRLLAELTQHLARTRKAR